MRTPLNKKGIHVFPGLMDGEKFTIYSTASPFPQWY